ncbi:MAG: hybrid sensor histidine kinase/response regulator [Planctomycetota bacterium]|nr:hybrid sensor histidine kinase/response regulator [Planctomycetota bacterium]
MRGYIEMTLKGMLGHVSPRQTKGLEVAIRNVDRLVALIDNLLNFARLDAGTDSLVLSRFKLKDLLDTIVRNFTPQIRKKGIKVGIECDENIELTADMEKLSRLFSNLVDNAVKFAPSKGRVKVIASPRSERNAVTVEIHDNGPGIPASKREKVFDRFYQVDSASTRKYGGTGIGLAICRDIARLHGGDMSIGASPLGGSVVSTSLPMLSDSRGKELSVEDGQLPSLVLLNCMLTEHCTRFASALQKAGLNCISFSGLSSALHGTIRHRPQVVISDLYWPEDGCFKLFHALRGNFRAEELRFVINGFLPLGDKRFYWFEDFYPSPIPLEYLRRLIVEVPEGSDVLLVNGYDELTDILGMLCEDRGLHLSFADGDAAELPIPFNRFELVLFDISRAHRGVLSKLAEHRCRTRFRTSQARRSEFGGQAGGQGRA